MFIIGLTGGFGTGKTTVAKMFAHLGAKIIDADKIAHRLMRKNNICFKPIVRYFGGDILVGGEIDRGKLSGLVFNSPGGLRKLCAIVHPPVIIDIKEKIKRYREIKTVHAVVIDAPLLIEAGLQEIVDYLIVVKANRNLQINRVARRMNIKKDRIKKRINAQIPMCEKIRLADIVIDNRGSLTKTKKKVRAIWLGLSKGK